MEEKYKFKSYSKHENGAYENYETQSVWARETAFKNEGNASEHMPARVHCESSQIVSLSVLACTPPTPPLGVGGYMLKMFAPTPQPPPELKNVTKIFYTKYFLSKFFNKILVNLIIHSYVTFIFSFMENNLFGILIFFHFNDTIIQSFLLFLLGCY